MNDYYIPNNDTKRYELKVACPCDNKTMLRAKTWSVDEGDYREGGTCYYLEVYCKECEVSTKMSTHSDAEKELEYCINEYLRENFKTEKKLYCDCCNRHTEEVIATYNKKHYCKYCFSPWNILSSIREDLIYHGPISKLKTEVDKVYKIFKDLGLENKDYKGR